MQRKLLHFLFFTALIFSIAQNSYAEKLWEKADRTLDNFCLKLAKNYHLKLLLTGYGNIVDSHQAHWDISLLSHEQLSLEEVRKLMVFLSHDFLCKIYTDPVLIKDLEANLEREEWKTPPALQHSRIGIKLSFWTKNFDRISKPYIAQSLFYDEKFEYFVTNPVDQSLVLLHSESLEEAFNLLAKTLPKPPATNKK